MTTRHETRRAMVLIIVLVVIVALSLGALTFSALMMGEREVAHATGRQLQATALAESGIEATRRFLAEQPDVQYGEGDWYSNADQFQGVLVVSDETPQFRGRFSVIAPGQVTTNGEMRFGLICESAKLNLNTLLSTGESTTDTNATSSNTTGDNPSSSGTTNTNETSVNLSSPDAASANTTSANATSARERLMALPEMTEEIADAILDWLDEDDEPREFGAEADYYESLPSPYRPANGPIACLDELLFVRGVTLSHLYGADRNRNGVIDSDESDTSNGLLPLGWSVYLTLHSREGIRQEDGSAKINLNQDDAEQLYEELETAFDADWANFIIAYRQQEQTSSSSQSNQTGDSNASNNGSNGSNDQPPTENNDDNNRNSRSSSDDNSGDSDTVKVEYADRVPEQLDLKKTLNRKIDSILDLIGASVQVSYDEGKRQVVVNPLFANESGAMRDYLPRLMARATTDDETTLTGRVNVNQAPAAVLAAVSGIDETLAEQIVTNRATDPASLADYQRDATWLLVDGLVTLDQMKTLLPYLTAGGSVYKMQAIGFFDEKGPVVRLEAILDATESPPRMLSLRNLTPLGRGFDPTSLGAQ